MSERARLTTTVEGYVQGVGFRLFVLHEARRLGLGGYVRNLASRGAVEVVAEGQREILEELLSLLRSGPAGALVDLVVENWEAYRGEFRQFEVRF